MTALARNAKQGQQQLTQTHTEIEENFNFLLYIPDNIDTLHRVQNSVKSHNLAAIIKAMAAAQCRTIAQ